MLGKADRKRLIGMTNVLLSFGLIMMCIISLTFITTFLRDKPKKDVVEISIENNVYPMRDSLEIAKLNVDKWASYSLHQAMYENGLRGGYPESGAGMLYEHDGIGYSTWYDDFDLAPAENDITDSLETATMEKFMEYTDDAKVSSYHTVHIPKYSGIDIDNAYDYGIKMAISSPSDLSLSQTSENGDVVTVARESLINLSIHVPYYKLYREALAYHKSLHEASEDMLIECNRTEIETTLDKLGYTFESKVMDTEDGSCLVKVEVATKKLFKVLESDETVFKRIRMVFMERMGSELRMGLTS